MSKKGQMDLFPNRSSSTAVAERPVEPMPEARPLELKKPSCEKCRDTGTGSCCKRAREAWQKEQERIGRY